MPRNRDEDDTLDRRVETGPIARRPITVRHTDPRGVPVPVDPGAVDERAFESTNRRRAITPPDVKIAAAHRAATEAQADAADAAHAAEALDARLRPIEKALTWAWRAIGVVLVAALGSAGAAWASVTSGARDDGATAERIRHLEAEVRYLRERLDRTAHTPWLPAAPRGADTDMKGPQP